MQSMTILLPTFGSFGDIHPYMALGLELKRRGHKAIIGTSEVYREKIESAGILFEPIRPDLPKPGDNDDTRKLFADIMDHRRGTEVVIKDVILSALKYSYTDTLAASQKHNVDLIIAHALSYSSPIVAEQLGIPWVFTALQPIIMFSADDPSVPPEAPWAIHLRMFGANFYRKLMAAGTKQFAEWAHPIYEIRAELGLPTNIPNPVLGGHFSPHLNLALFSKFFASAASDWPAKTVQTGFPFYDHHDSSQQPLSDTIQRFLDNGEPPIVFTLGTAAVRDARDFYKSSLAAARSIGKRSLLLTGYKSGNEVGLDLGQDCLVVDYAAYCDVFPRASAIVHQGGIGTTSQALRSGKPMLIMPYGHDQPDNAARCVKLGVAKLITRGNYSPASAATCLSHLLSDKAIVRCAHSLGEAISAERGPESACEAIEAMVRK